MGFIHDRKYIPLDKQNPVQELVDDLRSQTRMSPRSSYYSPDEYMWAAADLIEQQQKRILELEKKLA